ncbi:hypothetical protein M404DRAFT_36487 [Pisolithus tinctorius Marx 270]|uniref:Uncharacterized protein n=1 Tax=Pisolithus tinctorius Marx 270 TaxID=870435 RepID=A0A0C3NBQ9_PISTI|nr:hypothetical protein M404DRAFT_36487 [Pisolithus tinctorius Marx 270]
MVCSAAVYGAVILFTEWSELRDEDDKVDMDEIGDKIIRDKGLDKTSVQSPSDMLESESLSSASMISRVS